MSTCIAAIDIGTSKIATIVGEKTSSGIKIIGYSEAPSEGVVRGSVLNIQKAMNALVPTINEVNEQVANLPDTQNYRVREIYAGVSGAGINCSSNTLRRIRNKADNLISEEEIQAMLEEMGSTRVDNGEKIFQVIPQCYNVDEQMGVTDPVGMEGNEIEGIYKIFTGKANYIKSGESVYKRCNLTVKGTYLKPIASAEAILSEDDKELGVATVDIGGGTTELAIYHENILRYVAVIPFGGKSISEDISQVCGVSIKNAELLKRMHGTCVSEFAPENKVVAIRDSYGNTVKEIRFKQLALAIEARVCEIIASVLHEIELSGYKDKIRNGIVLTGGTSNLNHIQVLTRNITKMDVRIAFPGSQYITANSLEAVKKPSASTVVGLVIKGFEHSESIPEEERQPIQNNGTLFADEEIEIVEVQEQSASQKKKDVSQPKKEKKEIFKGLKSTLFGGGGLFGDSDDDA